MKYFTFFLLIFFSGFSHAEWAPVTTSVDGTSKYFIESTSIRKSGNFLRAWGMTDYERRNEFGNLSHKTYFEIDCTDRRIRSISATFFTENMGGGNAKSYNPDKIEWVYASPDSINDYIIRYVCAPRWN